MQEVVVEVEDVDVVAVADAVECREVNQGRTQVMEAVVDQDVPEEV